MNKLYYFKEEAYVAARAYCDKGGRRVTEVEYDSHRHLWAAELDKIEFEGELPCLCFDAIGIESENETVIIGWVRECKTMGDLARMISNSGGTITEAFRWACFRNGWQVLKDGSARCDAAYDPINHEVLSYDPEFGWVVRLGEPRKAKGGGRPEDVKPVNEIEF